MRRILQAAVVIALAAVSPPPHAASPVPVLVELFTSEGCSDCPPADVVLEKLIATQPIAAAEVIGLGEHVDYWDQQGWKDRFSSAALTNRQHIYGASFALESVYTPQMIVDGRAQFVGSDGNAARKAIERAIGTPHGVITITVDAGDPKRVALQTGDSTRSDVGPGDSTRSDVGPGDSTRSDVGRPFQGRQNGDAKSVALQVSVRDLPKSGRGDRADIIVAIAEDHLRSSVTRGENHGRTLTHAAVVRSMTTIGEASADGSSSARADIAIAPDWQRDQLKVVAFVQERRGRAILASASAPLQTPRR